MIEAQVVEALWAYFDGHIGASEAITQESFAREMAKANEAKQLLLAYLQQGGKMEKSNFVPAATLRGDGNILFHEGFREPLWRDLTLYASREDRRF